MGEKKNAYEIFIRKRDSLENLGISGRMILKQTLRQGGRIGVD
jgi:hypothetical protein